MAKQVKAADEAVAKQVAKKAADEAGAKQAAPKAVRKTIAIGQRVTTPDGIGTVKRCDVDGYNVQHTGYCFKHLHADVWADTG